MNSVLLVNREMTIVHAPCLVQGINGEKIGVSKFSPKHSCHVLELTPEAYEKAAKPLMQACHIALRRWEPHFVFDEVPEKVREFWDGYKTGLDGWPIPIGSCYERRVGNACAYGKTLEEWSKERAERLDELTEQFDANQDEAAAKAPPIYGMQTMESLANTPMDGDLMGSSDTFPTATIAECGAKLKEMAGLDGIHLPPVTAETKYWSLLKIAKIEGADISKCGTNAERAKAINEHRCQPR